MIMLSGIAWRVLLVLAVLAIYAAQPADMFAQTASGSALQMLRGLDAVRGEQIFREKGCFDCHSYDNWPGTFGPDLGPNRIRGASPSSLAAAMWNQAPSMWRAIRSRSVTGDIPGLKEEEAAALFAFFYSRLYFNDLADSPRGEDLFKARCSSCHEIGATSGSQKAGPAVATWESIKDPLVLVGRMWNHSIDMLDQALRAGRSWPRLSAQDATDVLSYLWRLPELRPGQSGFRFGDDVRGKTLFGERCLGCHTLGSKAAGKVDLTAKFRRVTVPQMIASMWNHAPAMKQSQPGSPMPTLSESDTRDLMTYLVVARTFEEAGKASRGEGLYRRDCALCHDGRLRDSGAPLLSTFRGSFDPVRMTSVLWSHGPKMLDLMSREGRRWPRFRDTEMLDLLTYINRQTVSETPPSAKGTRPPQVPGDDHCVAEETSGSLSFKE
jgi:cytochrome c2